MTFKTWMLAATLLLAAQTELQAQTSAAATSPDSVAAALRAFSLTEEGVEMNGRFVRGGRRQSEKARSRKARLLAQRKVEIEAAKAGVVVWIGQLVHGLAR